MRATGRSTPRWGVRDHTYNKPVVPFETRVSHVRDFHSVQRVAVWRMNKTRRLFWETLGSTDGHGWFAEIADDVLEEDTPVEHSCHLYSPSSTFLSCKLSRKLFIERYGASGVSANRDLHELFTKRSDRSMDPFLSLVSSYVSFSLFSPPFFNQVPLAFYLTLATRREVIT
ncbi:hypothetical protein ALC57_07104 [Trachymyrmex cornetzi]|uniref:Uncharacterized protein n=1 Tax=Trachymyrmex cornetzi TaxID=471704 RepID=A0A195E6Z5_9HYME|nr:hypothetical protein ALC57_07104 [Trachymyrmex cornetzi]